MKVCFVACNKEGYVRNKIVMNGLKENNIEIIPCLSNSPSILIRNIIKFFKFLKNKDKAEVIYVGLFGQPIVFLIRKFTKKPIIFDAFLSFYDSVCFDWKKAKPNSIIGKFAYWLDKSSCDNSDIILVDTEQHIDYFVKTFNQNRDKFRRSFVGADERLFYPRDENKNSVFTIFYYGTFKPLHGTDIIARAAKLLEKENIKIQIVGNGPEYKKIKEMIDKLGVNNIKLIEWIPYKELPLWIARSDLCLGGHFSDIEKAKRVIASKTFQFIAMKKPTIVGDNKASREIFEHKKDIYMCKMNNPESLAQSILELKKNNKLRKKIAENGYKLFKKKCTEKIIGKEIKDLLNIKNE